MAAYVIFYVESIRDRELLERYKQAARPTLKEAGGAVSIAYGRHEVLEGAALVGVVMVEFATYESARAWYYSQAYRAASELRTAATISHTVLAEGVARPAAPTVG
jgi:uncharacterized protein (DUF1330 family)